MSRENLIKLTIYWLVSFLIIYIFSIFKDPFLDEITSLLCSINFDDCIVWESQLPTFYFFIKPITSITFKVEVLRILTSILISFSIVLIVRTIEKIKKLKLIEEIIILFALSFTPLVYSSSLIRPYSVSFFLSSISIYYFVEYLKNRRFEEFKKSVKIDLVGLMFFYFNILVLFPKFLYFLFFEKKNSKKVFITIFKLSFFPSFILFVYIISLFINYKTYEGWNLVTEHYKYYKDYYLFFLINYPVELFKEQTVIKQDFSSPYSLLFKYILQVIFFLPVFEYIRKKTKNEYFFLYFLILMTILLFNISFSLITSKYLIFSRQFVYLSLQLLSFFLIIITKENKLFLIVFLPLSFIDYTIYRLNHIFKENYIYFPIFEVIKYLSNEEIIVIPYYMSQYFWYYESFIERRNLTIYDIYSAEFRWYEEKNDSLFTLRYWKSNISQENKIIESNYKKVYKFEILNITKIFINILDAKKYCSKIIEEIKKSNLYILICK